MENQEQTLPSRRRQEIDAIIDSEKRAYESLVHFREEFIPSKDDSSPASFHEEWSDILLNGKENFAIEAFRESGETCRSHTSKFASRFDVRHASQELSGDYMRYPDTGRAALAGSVP